MWKRSSSPSSPRSPPAAPGADPVTARHQLRAGRQLRRRLGCPIAPHVVRSSLMGADIDGAIETRAADGRWEVEADLLDCQLGRDRDAWDCLFGFGGGGDA